MMRYSKKIPLNGKGYQDPWKVLVREIYRMRANLKIS